MDCITIHKTKPWIKDFNRVVVKPLQSTDPRWLGEIVRYDGDTWFVPTDVFWTLHCQAAHSGKTCNVQAHVDFLSIGGKFPEFLYGSQLNDGTIIVQNAQQFEEECAYFTKNKTQL